MSWPIGQPYGRTRLRRMSRKGLHEGDSMNGYISLQERAPRRKGRCCQAGHMRLFDTQCTLLRYYYFGQVFLDICPSLQ